MHSYFLLEIMILDDGLDVISPSCALRLQMVAGIGMGCVAVCVPCKEAQGKTLKTRLRCQPAHTVDSQR